LDQYNTNSFEREKKFRAVSWRTHFGILRKMSCKKKQSWHRKCATKYLRAFRSFRGLCIIKSGAFPSLPFPSLPFRGLCTRLKSFPLGKKKKGWWGEEIEENDFIFITRELLSSFWSFLMAKKQWCKAINVH
jgi:hypothetical protein